VTGSLDDRAPIPSTGNATFSRSPRARPWFWPPAMPPPTISTKVSRSPSAARPG
jgi:hypothetical protein